MPEPIVETPVEEVKVEKVVETPVVEEKKEEAPVETPPVDKSAEAIEKINETLAKQTELLNTLAAKQDEKAEEKDWTLEQLREAELKVYSGEYEQKWLPLINEKRATLIAKQIADERETKYTKESTWNEIQNKWDAGMAKAVEDFGKEATDPNSKLFKTAQDILLKDPGYKRFQELKSNGKALNQIDPSLIDPNLQYKCFEIAHSRLERLEKDAPKVPSKGGSKSALGGPTLPKADVEDSRKLEERAFNDPNDRQAWLQLMKDGLAKNRARG